MEKYDQRNYKICRSCGFHNDAKNSFCQNIECKKNNRISGIDPAENSLHLVYNNSHIVIIDKDNKGISRLYEDDFKDFSSKFPEEIKALNKIKDIINIYKNEYFIDINKIPNNNQTHFLSCLSSYNKNKKIQYIIGRAGLGRNEFPNDLKKFISAFHLEIYFSEKERYWLVEDNNSKNYTFLNNEKLPPFEPMILKNKYRIKMSSSIELQVEIK